MIGDRFKNNKPEIKQIAECEVVKKFIYLASLVTDQSICTKKCINTWQYFERL